MSTPCENCGSDFRVCISCDLYNGKYIEIPDNATVCDIEQIRAEIEGQKECRCFDDDDMFIYRTGLDDALDIIDKHIKGVSE